MSTTLRRIGLLSVSLALVFWLGCGAATSTMETGAMEAPAGEEMAAAEETSAAEATEQAEAPAKTEAEKPTKVQRKKPPKPAAPSLLAPSEEQKPMDSSKPDDEVVVLNTTKGRIVIELYPGDAPKTVENFKKLIRERFYEGAARRFHRYVKGFVIQGGDPKGDGTGGPGYTIPAEIKRKHVKGAVAMARLPDNVNPNKESNGSQFYICLDDLPQLDGEYTVFGQVIQGMSSVMRLRVRDEITSTQLLPRSEVVKE